MKVVSNKYVSTFLDISVVFLILTKVIHILITSFKSTQTFYCQNSNTFHRLIEVIIKYTISSFFYRIDSMHFLSRNNNCNFELAFQSICGVFLIFIRQISIIFPDKLSNLLFQSHQNKWVHNSIFQKKKMLLRLAKYCFTTANKLVATPQEAIAGIKDNDFMMFGGFGICGIPMNLINAVSQSGVKNLTIASNDGGAADVHGDHAWGLQFLFRNKQVKRMISSYLGYNKHYEALYLGGELELQFCPQGTLAEKIRCGGAGIAGFYTKTGSDTLVEKGGIPIKFHSGTMIPEILSDPKETRIIKGQKFLFQESYFGDFSFVKALKADRYGNLVFNKSARNFNQDMAKAAKIVVAEVEEIVENGEISPDQVHVPGVYVDRIFKSDPNNIYSKKLIERPAFSSLKKGSQSSYKVNDIKFKIMKRAAKEVHNGANINLGIGTPTLLPQTLPPGIQIHVHAQNGVLGAGPYPFEGEEDPDLINAGKQTITILPAGSFFSSSQSFSIIRGGHLDFTMLGALQVSQSGDIANWMIPGKMAKGMRGAMDLVNSGSKVIVVMQHNSKVQGKGRFKLVEKCSLPLTAAGKAWKVITEKAVFENVDGKLVLTEIAQGLSFEQLQEDTDFKIVRNEVLKTF